MLALLFAALFGSPLASLHARAYHAVAPHPDAARIALVLTTIAADDADPSGALALLIGIGTHETGFRTMTQAGASARKGAVSWWQMEEPRAEARALYLRDPVAAGREALRRARASLVTCGTLNAYASGRCGVGGDVGAELGAYVTAARWRSRP